jgi:Chaperone of endosialidase
MKGNKHMQRITSITYPAFALFAFGCFALLPRAQAQLSPPPDGCYSNFTTAEGCDALSLLTTGAGNTALGWRSLFLDTAGNFNTGVGGGALALNDADSNTAVGAAVLLLNTTGTQNVAVGTDAMVFNDSGPFNDAVGAFALMNNIDGEANNAFGNSALLANIHAGGNTAMGDFALGNNDNTGNGFASRNTAVGSGALVSNIDGAFNTAVGSLALLNNFDASDNTVVGNNAGQNILSGSDNIYIGDSAGTLDNTGVPLGDETGLIRIGSSFSGTSACFINGIANNGPFADTVTIDPATGQLGGLPSSARFKKDIEPMGESSEAIYSLKPVTFHYNKDKTNTPWFGLIAEDVAKVNPALIGVDKEGKPYCVAYDKVNAMLLNEFLKAHRKMEAQEATIARQQKQIDALAAGLQKVNAQLELSKPAPQTVLNNH